MGELYPVTCAQCGAPAGELPFLAQTPKLCERCYCPQPPEQAELLGLGRMKPVHVSLTEEAAGEKTGPLGAKRRISEFRAALSAR